MTKKAQHYYDLLKKHWGRNIRQCYANPSYEKELAYERLVDLYYSSTEFDVITYGVVSYNTFTFTMAFIVADTITHQRYLMIETANNFYKYKID